MNAKQKVQDIGEVQSIDQDIYKLRLNHPKHMHAWLASNI